MGIDQIRALKAAKTGTVMTAAQVKEAFQVKGSSSMAGKFKSGDYECSKGACFFRSEWEGNYALYLDFLVKNKQIKDWEYEADTFFFDKIKLGTRSYRTDFKLFNLDGSVEYHEVKGYMDSKSQTKLKRMKKYFPDVKIVLIEKKQYQEILKKLGGVIKFY